MEIIKQGDISKLKQTKKFECRRCGCIFLADDDEYKYSGSQYNESYYQCACPTCNTPVYSD